MATPDAIQLIRLVGTPDAPVLVDVRIDNDHASDPRMLPSGSARTRPKIDRIACLWLIRRFIDPSAVFLFVAPPEVLDVAHRRRALRPVCASRWPHHAPTDRKRHRFRATPFDIEDKIFWSHRGDLCTFDVMVEEFGLHSPALDRLALIVRAADTARLELAPQAAGLLAASLGLSRMHKDDLVQLDASFSL